jgi:hypothetical protein
MMIGFFNDTATTEKMDMNALNVGDTPKKKTSIVVQLVLKHRGYDYIIKRGNLSGRKPIRPYAK